MKQLNTKHSGVRDKIVEETKGFLENNYEKKYKPKMWHTAKTV